MDRYVRVDQRKTDQSAVQENEVRIMSNGKMRSYIAYASALLKDKGHETIVLKAMGKAINKAVVTVEILKRRVEGLYQMTEIGSIDITDTWEPIEEGLSRLETTRHVSLVTITLSTQPLDSSAPGFQEPLLSTPGEASPLGAPDGILTAADRYLSAEDINQGDMPSYQEMVEMQASAARPPGSGAPLWQSRGPGRGRGRFRGRGRGRGRGRSRSVAA